MLFTDVEGSTRLLDRLGADAYAEALAGHRRMLRRAFADNGGVEVDTQGDSFFVAFPSASGALAAAEQAQAALASGLVRVRIGVHTGTPLLTEEGYVGADVHRAARIAAAGSGGQVLLSRAARELVEVEVRDLGEHRLKDLSAPERIFQLGIGEFPPLKTLYQTNLPVQPTPLIGRERELRELLQLLDEERLVTVTGTGGCGKTRLAVQAAAEVTEGFRDGVWWVSLAALRDPIMVEPAIAQVTGAKDALVDHLRGKQMLLLLDNFEQVIAAASRVAELLAADPELRILATSRERLGIAAEREYVLPTMQQPDAVALFVARARQLSPRFEPDDAVADVCHRLDGLPLAIELAAARIKFLRPDQILERLSPSLDLLTRGRREAPQRHQTLRATIEWSYDLLSDEERQLFRRLAVFAGSFNLAAAEAVAGADVDTLGALIDKSLLRTTGDGRFFMLETIRDYALVQLGGSKLRTVREAHATYFVELAEETWRARWGEGGRLDRENELLDELDADMDNLRAARDWADANAGELALRLAAKVWWYWRVRGFVTEGREWLRAALSTSVTGDSGSLRAQALRGASFLASVQNDFTAATRFAGEAVDLSRDAGSTADLALSLEQVGMAESGLGHWSAAREALEEAERNYRAAGHSSGVTTALHNLGLVTLNEGRLDEADCWLRESLAFARAHGFQEHAANALGDLGFVALYQHRDQDACRLFRECARGGQAVQWNMLVAGALLGLAACAARRGAAERAARLLAAADRAASEHGHPPQKYQRPIIDEATAAAQTALGITAYDNACQGGSKMSLNEAVEYALQPRN